MSSTSFLTRNPRWPRTSYITLQPKTRADSGQSNQNNRIDVDDKINFYLTGFPGCPGKPMNPEGPGRPGGPGIPGMP